LCFTCGRDLDSQRTLPYMHVTFTVLVRTETSRNAFPIYCKVKVKCTLVQAPRLCTDRTAHRGSRGIALLFHNHGIRRGRGVSFMPRPFFFSGKDPLPILQEAVWAPKPVGKVRKISPPPGFDPRTVQPVASRYTD
jgi:hypothetical protein